MDSHTAHRARKVRFGICDFDEPWKSDALTGSMCHGVRRDT